MVPLSLIAFVYVWMEPVAGELGHKTITTKACTSLEANCGGIDVL